MNFLAYDRPNDTVYAATDLGVFFMQHDNKVWTKLGDNLPNTATEDLKIQASSGKLYVGTFGRGTWRIPLVAGTPRYNPQVRHRPGRALEPGQRHGPRGGRDDAAEELDTKLIARRSSAGDEPVRRPRRAEGADRLLRAEEDQHRAARRSCTRRSTRSRPRTPAERPRGSRRPGSPAFHSR